MAVCFPSSDRPVTGRPSPSNGPGVAPTCHVTNSRVVLLSDDLVRLTKGPLRRVNLGAPAKSKGGGVRT